VEVQDPGGGRIPGAQITIVPAPPGTAWTQTADQTGTLAVPLSPGSYEVTAAFPGFRAATERIEVERDRKQPVELTLPVGGSSGPETVATEQPTERAPLGELTAPCSQRELTAALLPTDPVYADAADLGRKLDGLGFTVRCTLASKRRHIFAGQIGAALYRTSAGDFEALFLPGSGTFDGLEIVEQKKPGRYLYSFRGMPHSRVRMESSKPSYFILRKNVLFYVRGDDGLAAGLQSRLSR
jgi:carboxypeptidase family protein